MADSKPKSTPGGSDAPVDIDLPLDQIQGNILGGFFKDHQHFLFLTFNRAGLAREWIKHITNEVATSEQVIAFNNAFKTLKGSNGQETLTARWMNVAFTHSGLALLEAPDVDAFPEEFKAGMKARASVLGDLAESSPENWIEPLGDKDVHALLILAADDPKDLEEDKERHKQLLERHEITVAFEQAGEARRDQPGHEHFGFDDGVSQPGVRDARVTKATTSDNKTGLPGQDRLWPGEFVVGWPRQFDPEDQPPPGPGPQPTAGYPGPTPQPGPEPDSTTKVPATPPKPDWSLNGSYLVFRRLRQDVPAFRQFIEAKSVELQMPAELLRAKLVGRYQSGAPLERTHDQATTFDPELEDPSIADPTILERDRINFFDFVDGSDDLSGGRVPHAAHVRKVYPRDSVPPKEIVSEAKRILRRGIPFGKSFQEGAPADGPQGPNPDYPNDRGLIFVCYQGSLARQFEFIQSTWANRPDKPDAGGPGSSDADFPGSWETASSEHRQLRYYYGR
jgi:Dyp-type peroxidase family